MSELADIERALMTALGTIAEHWDALIEPASSGGVASKPQPKALYTHPDDDERTDDLPAIDRRIALRDDVTASLNGWARIIVEERGLTHHIPLGTDTLGLVEFLQRWARWFSGHDAAEAATDELRMLAGKVQATAVPQRRDWMPLGTCPLEITLDPETILGCGGQVRAYPGRDPECHKCGTTGSAEWWERVMFPDMEIATLVTADELVLVLHRAFGGTPVKPTTIRQWISRKVIEPSGKDDKGRTLFNRAYVVRALSDRLGA